MGDNCDRKDIFMHESHPLMYQSTPVRDAAHKSTILPSARGYSDWHETNTEPVLSSLTENSKGAQGGVHLLLLPLLWGGQPQRLEEGSDIRTPHLQPNLRTGHNGSWKKRLAAPGVFRNVRQTFTRKKIPTVRATGKHRALYSTILLFVRDAAKTSTSLTSIPTLDLFLNLV